MIFAYPKTRRWRDALGLLISLLLLMCGSAHATESACMDLFQPASLVNRPLNPDLDIYESARDLTLGPQVGSPILHHGWSTVVHDQNGEVSSAKLQILVDNIKLDQRIQIVGPFNNWGKNLRPTDTFRPVEGQPELFEVTVHGIQHAMEYRLLVNGQQLLDPTAPLFTTPEYLASIGRLAQGDYLNSVFWDFNGPKRFKMLAPKVDLRYKPLMISENEAFTMVENWTDYNGQRGPREKGKTYQFIAQSGIVGFLKKSGINAIELLPFNQTVDGAAWNLRYQVYGLFAPDSQYGSPDDFKQMVEEFHKNGIAVVMDSVLSHFPFHANEDGDRALSKVGLHKWTKADGRPLYAGSLSPWDSYRYDYQNPYVRRFLAESVTFMMREYQIDAVRFDNIDGILGEPGGAELIHELNSAIRAENPSAPLIAESFDENPPLQHRIDRGGFGMNARNDGAIFELWRSEMQGPTEGLSMVAFDRTLGHIWDVTEAAMVRYLTNHDESANARGGFTGSYPASLLGPDPYYIFNKIKMADSFNMVSGAFHLSTPQTRLLQTGTFYSNPNVDWDRLRTDPRAGQLWNYFSALSNFTQDHAVYFNFASLDRDISNHYDDDNKVISLKRTDPNTGKALYILINMSHKQISNYQFGVSNPGTYAIAFDSDQPVYGGTGAFEAALPHSVLQTDTKGAHGKSHSLTSPLVTPYSVTIFEQL